MLAPSWFKRCLTGGFSEAVTLAEKGTVDIDDPKQPGADLLAAVALLADYYGCNALVDDHLDLWLSETSGRWRRQRASTSDDGAPLFRLDLQSRYRLCAAVIIMEESRTLIEAHGVPIDPKISDYGWLMTYRTPNVFMDELGLLFAKAPYENLSIKTIVSKLTSGDRSHYEVHDHGWQWSRFHCHMGPEHLSAIFAGLSDRAECLDLRRVEFE
ncbi:hypothetical protein ASPCAL13270 [Aspergillus calidoustus]|uniref:Uncharacterized protein n=1 Tax=Aspergillus calidoustus TaxID=454130 RepID=A0A0U5GCR3_ASPCI|nr:hypothetical protein ASPCAL13270 [Aspergillus calidoustus]